MFLQYRCLRVTAAPLEGIVTFQSDSLALRVVHVCQHSGDVCWIAGVTRYSSNPSTVHLINTIDSLCWRIGCPDQHFERNDIFFTNKVNVQYSTVLYRNAMNCEFMFCFHVKTRDFEREGRFFDGGRKRFGTTFS
jgi:hypothetical protein